MSCNISNDTLRAFSLGILDARECEEVASHLETCSICREVLSQFDIMMQVLDTAFDETPPEWLLQKTVAIVKDRKEKKTIRSPWRVPVVSGIAAIILIVLLNGGVERFIGMFDQMRNRSANSSKMTGFDKRGTVSEADSAFAAKYLPGVAADQERIGDWDTEIDLLGSLLSTTTGGLSDDFKNPVHDRSIYKELGIRTDIAALLL